jgi:hypothetical protein
MRDSSLEIMRFSHKHKFILINNWKCGCSSIGLMFSKYTDQFGWAAHTVDTDRPLRDKYMNEQFGLTYSDVVHAPAKRVKEIFKKKEWPFESYIKITSVRNPWERIVSLYSFLTEKDRWQSWNLKSEDVISFTEFVKKSVPTWQGGPRKWNTYEMTHDSDGRSLVDYTVKLENLQEELTAITEKHFPDFKLNYGIRINASTHDHYSTYYDEESKAIVADLLSYDIERWGYKFEEEQE